MRLAAYACAHAILAISKMEARKLLAVPGQPFVEQVGYPTAFGGDQLVEYEQLRRRAMKVPTPHRKKGGVPGEIAAIEIPRQAVQVPFLELIAFKRSVISSSKRAL